MDVGDWLRSLGLGQYEAAFRENAIDGKVLPKLTAEDLKDLGVVTVGHRRMMLSAIEALSASFDAEPPDAGAARAASSPASRADAERRPITVMFCDLVGSTGLAASLDAEDWRNLVGAYLDEASAAVTGLGGHVLKKLGDGLMALFGYPHAQENDCERAVRAALAIQRALADLNARNARSGAPELAARIGLDAGPVVVEALGEVFGEAPNLAARVQAAAEPGTVLVTAAVQRQIAGLFVAEDRGEHQLRGVPAPVTLYRIVRASGGGRRGGARSRTTLVGREDELALIMRRWARTLQGEGQFVQLVGEPGIGKSRLIEEFRGKLSETPHTWVEWASSQLLQNTPLHPVAEWGRQRFGGAEVAAERRLADLENTLGLIGLDAAEYAPLLAPLVDIPLKEGRAAKLAPEELRRRQLTALTAWLLAGARSQAVALAFEDLHWADPTSLDLMRALAERGQQAPLFIIATTRPEFRAPWSLRSHHSVVSLAPLNRGEVKRMIGELASRHALSSEVVEGLSERTGGVPLFVEEVTRLLLERGAEGGAQAIPPTLQQSLAARLDRLGPAREIAQIGAVLGRDFAFALLQAVSGLDEASLRSALERLAEADLLIVEDAGPQVNYRFKHALIQDAAYESLLKSRRQALHRRAAEVLRGAEAEPEAIAYHFTEAGLDDLAIEWWGRAGDQALRRSAFQEAIAHLGKAIAMADKAAGGKAAGASGERWQLRVAYGNALFQARGYGAVETAETFARARDFAVGDKGASERLAAGYGLWVGSYARGELSAMREHAAALLGDVGARSVSPEAGVAYRAAGETHWFAGEYREAREHLERALALFQPGRDDDLAFRFGQDAGVAVMLSLALMLWPLGEIGRAVSLIGAAEARIAGLAHIGTRAFGRTRMALFSVMRGDMSRVAVNAVELARLTREHDLPFWRAAGVFLDGLATAENGAPERGLDDMRRGVELLREQNVRVFDGLRKRALAEVEARAGNPARAIATLDEALAMSERIGHRAFDAELYRVRGEILLMREPVDAKSAEEAFQTAIAVAKHQGTRSFELRAALGLAKLYQSTARPAEAHAVLVAALEGLAPSPFSRAGGGSGVRASELLSRPAGPSSPALLPEGEVSANAEMPEIAEAQALLAALAETSEVKAQAARRQRQAQLHVAYGNALIAARGPGALETTEAFARAREQVGGDKDTPERLAADYGLYVGSLIRGELPSMRAHAAAFLTDVEARPDSGEAGVAHRAQGITNWFAGEYREARPHLERALALFQPGRDDDLSFWFGHDAGAAAMAYLALASWPLGEIGGAISLVERMRERTVLLTHSNTLAFAATHAGFFALMSKDSPRAQANTLALARIVGDHDLPVFRAFGAFFEGCAAADAGTLTDGLERMRRGAELLRERNVLLFDGLVKIALAEAEAQANDVDRALAILDEALARSEQTGHRTFEAELHRVRAETLLKRDPANSAQAEEAFQTAIAIADQQGARSFGLRAALALAKLYQSTARAAEAHAVLAPALEGFAPTPEMPEIAEARAQLAGLAEMEEVKAAIAHRLRRVDLQTSYGQALQFGKGFAAEETRAAFARVAELAGPNEHSAARFAAFYGQWLGSFLRGDFSLAQEMAETFLREAEADGRATEAGTARRLLGFVLFHQGDLKAARSFLERALADFVPERDGDARRLDGQATGTAILALVAWHLGEVERARLLIQQAIRRARELGHPATLAQVLTWNAYLEIHRGDVVAARLAADAAIKLAEDHGMNLFAVASQVCAYWARGRLVDPDGGANGLRQALQAYMAQGNKNDAPLFHGMLAELEGAKRDPDSALILIDQGLTIAEETAGRFMEPYLHRLRGDILLKRNPADPAPAEDAYRTALAIAKQQGARTYELLASLSLAKLYQSTGRPADAHAVLAPALEGFSPTPEMPEIAEAQALLAALAKVAANKPAGAA
jgi:class 3 adenylate cyclase/tetratricopeptide (TPR) repeat protein